ncbi:hypothetical protein DL93DRAFT_2101288 [Clavulina sp. PMI_390]|nr:hypothetical protein DL93DRAFT_2101288 [Clavulina sp. PMI_390]
MAGLVSSRHETFYFDQPDTLVFQVEKTLFRPHVFPLKRYCDFFRDLLELKCPTTGSDDEHPLILETIHLKDASHPNITAKTFEMALRTLYPELVLQLLPETGILLWLRVLDASHRWQCTWMRWLALRRIEEKYTIRALHRLSLAVKYDIGDWLKQGCEGLCRLQRFPTREELAFIPGPKITEVLRIRESLRSLITRTLSSKCEDDRWPPRQCRQERLEYCAVLLKSSSQGETDIIDGLPTFRGWWEDSSSQTQDVGCIGRFPIWRETWARHISTEITNAMNSRPKEVEDS